MFRLGTIPRFLVFLMLFVPKIEVANANSHHGVAALQNLKPGVIHSLEREQNSLWVTSENGLFRLTGTYAEEFPIVSDLISSGYISNVHVQPDYLWLSVYGKGLIRFDRQRHTAEHVRIKEDVEHRFWDVRGTDNRLLISYINGLII